MVKVSETKNMIVWFDKDRQLQKTSWIGDNADITESEIKDTINLEADLITKHRPKYILSDDSQRLFVYNVDIQNWVATQLAGACIKAGVVKFAVIMPTDLISELSTEQVGDEAGNIPVKIQYFKNESSAINWLFE